MYSEESINGKEQQVFEKFGAIGFKIWKLEWALDGRMDKREDKENEQDGYV